MQLRLLFIFCNMLYTLWHGEQLVTQWDDEKPADYHCMLLLPPPPLDSYSIQTGAR